jgi:hypothetical protein
MNRLLLAALLLGFLLPHHTFANTALLAKADSMFRQDPRPDSSGRDGSRDFDFNIGRWHTHIRRLLNPLTGSANWIVIDGTVVVRKVWDGRAQLEEIEADGPKGHWEGLTLFLYNPEAHQWSMHYSNSGDGNMETPSIGEFKNGRGEFYDQETYRGRAVLVRGVWSDITANSHRFEISFSDDGGKTWEPNFIADLTRDNNPLSRVGGGNGNQ